MNPFSVDSRVLNDIAVLYPRGYLNNIVGEGLEAACSKFLDEGITRIVLNFSRVEFINSIGISILLAVMEKMRDMGGTLCFTDLGSLHSDTFEMLGLSKHMLVFPTEEEALAHLRGEEA